MDWVVLVLIATGVLVGALLFPGDEGGTADTGGGGGGGGGISASEPGAGGYGPEGLHDLITGTSGADYIVGNDYPEVINANGGDDTVLGAGGDDRIFGLGENDILNPGAGEDSVFGGDGSDAVDGGFLSGTFLDTTALLQSLVDRIDAGFALTPEEYARAAALGLVDVEGDLDNDLIRGEDGTDILSDALGANIFYGDLGRDVIFSLDIADPSSNDLTPLAYRQDTVFGGAGEDTIFADDGDIVSGGGAVDHFVVMHELNGVTTDAYVTLRDFDPTTETLEITELDGLHGTTLTYTDGTGGPDGLDGVYVLMGGTEVAFLEGLTAADLTAKNVFVTTSL